MLEVNDRRVALTETAYQGHPPHDPHLPGPERGARQVLWLVTGAEKREPLAKLLAADRSIPAGRVENEKMIVLPIRPPPRPLSPRARRSAQADHWRLFARVGAADSSGFAATWFDPSPEPIRMSLTMSAGKRP